jgi:hypothetical protein
MSEFASAVERARRAFASLSQIEGALARAPTRRDLQTNLVAFKKLAQQSQDQLLQLSALKQIEICNYRLLPEATEHYSLGYVSESLLAYQNLFSQVHDARRNGPKVRARLDKEALQESALDFAYSYSGSLGVVLFIQNERDFFNGKIDPSIDSLLEVLNIDSRAAVRQIADQLGAAVVKRVHDWSRANIDGGFATDVRWNKSDGHQLGGVVERKKMENIVDLIVATSDEKTRVIEVTGMLVGGDIASGIFHFTVPNGLDYRGHLAEEFLQDTEMLLGKTYSARIRERETMVYATEKVEVVRELIALINPAPSLNVPRPSVF